MNTSIEILLRKIEQFVRKYYTFQLLRGLLISTTLWISLFLAVSFLENYAYFSTHIRLFLFIFFMICFAVVLTTFVLLPIARILRLGRNISTEQAAVIIGRHFPEVDDKLLNVLQLGEMAHEKSSNELLIAGIEQKTNELRWIPFQIAIDLRKAFRLFKYAALPVAILLMILLVDASFIANPAKRIVDFNTEYIKPLPYSLELINTELEALQYEDFEVRLAVKGDELPDYIYIFDGSNRHMMQENTDGSYAFTFHQVIKSFQFQMQTDEYKTRFFEVSVYPKPVILDLDIELEYPDYTLKEDILQKGDGDLFVPQGTKASWAIKTRDTDELELLWDDSSRTIFKSNRENEFAFQQELLQALNYQLIVRNSYVINPDTLQYIIQVIPDEYPKIQSGFVRDSTEISLLFFNGSIQDDYGFSALYFYYSESPTGPFISEKLRLNKGLRQDFYHFIDFDAEHIALGTELYFFFRVYDNDAVNGSKYTDTPQMTYRLPSEAELKMKQSSNFQKQKDNLGKSIEELKKLQQEIDAFQKQLVDQEQMGWKEKERLKELLVKHEEIMQKLEENKLLQEEKQQLDEQLSEEDLALIEKQKELEELMDKILDDEMKDLMKELQELMEELGQDQMQQSLEDMQMESQDLENYLDRSLELFKQLELEKELKESINELQALKEDQGALEKETEDKNSNWDELNEKQERLNDKFEDLEQKIEELEGKNQDLNRPYSFEETKGTRDEVKESMQQSKQAMEKKNRSGSSGQQKNSQQKMQELSEQLQSNLMQMQQGRLQEDAETLRKIMDNLLKLSFDQETLLLEAGTIKLDDPAYIELMENQQNINEEMKMVEDSLIALSERQEMVKPFILDELRKIETHLELSGKNLADRRSNEASKQQQYVMTSMNNLALMLEESLSNMQSQMQMPSQMQSKGDMPQPGMAMPGLEQMRSQQQQLLEQMKQSLESMGNSGKDGSNAGKQQLSEKLARMAAEQQAIRKQMQKYTEQMQAQGEETRELQKIIEGMDKTEEDLVNKMLRQQTLLRQQDILSRLLESEKAELERQQEERREAEQAKNYEKRNPEDFFEYKSQRTATEELLKTIPVEMKPFYKKLVTKYQYQFDQDDR